MKIKSGFLLRSVAGKNIVVPVGAELDFGGMITLNDTGKFMWEQLINETDVDDLLKKIVSEYDVDEETAKNDINIFINKLKELNILEG